MNKPPVTVNPWAPLRRLTSARIALGRAGPSLPTQAVLDFGLAHARARDAVHLLLDSAAVERDLRAAGFDALRVHSAAPERSVYLRRPDLGRKLDEASRHRMQALARREFTSQAQPEPAPDVVFVIADGLSAPAAAGHGVQVLQALRPRLAGWRIPAVVIAEQARVALGDEIGELLGAAQTVMLIGERPGLSAPDSLGIYLTHAPRVGRTDAERNCISNIRPEGLGYEQAARTLAYLLAAARQLGYSGVRLKDGSAALPPGR